MIVRIAALPSSVMSDRAEDPLRIGVSSCLLGQNVRWDGGHKRDRFLTDELGPFVEWVPVCPEVELGLGTPRPTVRLVRRAEAVRMVEPKSGADHTDAMRAYARRRVRELDRADLSGYVLKKDSPSCGMERVKVYAESGAGARDGRGLFAEALLERFPQLPVEEEGRLGDPRLRENFVVRLFAYRRLRRLFASRWSTGRLVAFHTAHKLLLLAHLPAAYTRLGRLVADARSVPREELARRYQSEFMEALARPSTRRLHTNVLQHMAGYFRGRIDTADRDELLSLIDEHRLGRLPLVVPLTLVRHHARRLGVAYLLGQVYLDPHPKELMLLNHV
jgi:uncharacterized protein YbgA (DUF1722 family)/uncharacterized protein YbbK (DUF523 family)